MESPRQKDHSLWGVSDAYMQACMWWAVRTKAGEEGGWREVGEKRTWWERDVGLGQGEPFPSCALRGLLGGVSTAFRLGSCKPQDPRHIMVMVALSLAHACGVGRTHGADTSL